jgi:hypothetical protein
VSAHIPQQPCCARQCPMGRRAKRRGALPLPYRRSHSSDRNCAARTTSPRNCDRDIEVVAAAAVGQYAIVCGELAVLCPPLALWLGVARHLPASRRAANSEFSCSSPIAAWRVCLRWVNLTARRMWGVRHRTSCLYSHMLPVRDLFIFFNKPTSHK